MIKVKLRCRHKQRACINKGYSLKTTKKAQCITMCHKMRFPDHYSYLFRCDDTLDSMDSESPGSRIFDSISAKVLLCSRSIVDI